METAVTNSSKFRGGVRSSNIELFRVISMLMIVAHHYVVNSGLLDCIDAQSSLRIKDYFLLLLGWGGKTGINCFVLITGYFMCTSNITKRKFFKLLGEVYFYKVVIWGIFFISGYEPFSPKDFLKMLFPFFTVADNFTACFLLFYLLIPFLNKLIHALKEKEHLALLAWCMGVYVVLPSFAKANVVFNYVTWFSILYIVASYDFEKVQKILNKNRAVFQTVRAKSEQIRAEYQNDLAGMVFCADCGRPMEFERLPHGAEESKKVCYYICKARQADDKCIGHQIPEKLLKALIMDQLHLFIVQLSDKRKVLEELQKFEDVQNPVYRAKGEIMSLTDKVSQMAKKREQLYADYVAGVVDSEDYQLIREDYSRQYDGLRAALQEAENKKVQVEQQIEEWVLVYLNLWRLLGEGSIRFFETKMKNGVRNGKQEMTGM